MKRQACLIRADKMVEHIQSCTPVSAASTYHPYFCSLLLKPSLSDELPLVTQHISAIAPASACNKLWSHSLSSLRVLTYGVFLWRLSGFLYDTAWLWSLFIWIGATRHMAFMSVFRWVGVSSFALV
jgi:hypothetical protein